MWDDGCWVTGVGCPMTDNGSWLLAVCFWLLAVGSPLISLRSTLPFPLSPSLPFPSSLSPTRQLSNSSFLFLLSNSSISPLTSQLSPLYRSYNIIGRMKNLALFIPLFLLKHFISYTCFPSIPMATSQVNYL